jgi:hypothetical protein
MSAVAIGAGAGRSLVMTACPVCCSGLLSPAGAGRSGWVQAQSSLGARLRPANLKSGPRPVNARCSGPVVAPLPTGPWAPSESSRGSWRAPSRLWMPSVQPDRRGGGHRDPGPAVCSATASALTGRPKLALRVGRARRGARRGGGAGGCHCHSGRLHCLSATLARRARRTSASRLWLQATARTAYAPPNGCRARVLTTRRPTYSPAKRIGPREVRAVRHTLRKGAVSLCSLVSGAATPHEGAHAQHEANRARLRMRCCAR